MLQVYEGEAIFNASACLSTCLFLAAQGGKVTNLVG